MSYREGTPLKRAAEEDESDAELGRPPKLQKRALSIDYLALLNRDIEDAAHQICLEDGYDLLPSQIGLTYWTSVEKRIFFEALARLGKDDVATISLRLGTKSVPEIRQYIDLLQRARDDWQRRGHRYTVEPSEMPAAVELSLQCCNALDEAADAVASRVERRDDKREEAKWGEYWEITPRIALDLDRDATAASENPRLRSLRFFQLTHWLKLSTRIFMNSATPGNNWNTIGDEPPSVWASTFDDFYSLAVSVTRRLVHTTLYFSMSRIRSKQRRTPSTAQFVRRRDAEAAIASLGMLNNRHEFWMQSARRLRLDVYEDPSAGEEDSDAEPMEYEEIERALGGGPGGFEQEAQRQVSEPLGNPSAGVEGGLSSSDEESEEEEEEEEGQKEGEGPVTEEEQEVLLYSAVDYPRSRPARKALRTRIESEQAREAHAGQHDEYVSAQAEAELWKMLRKQPPRHLGHVPEPMAIPRSTRGVEDVYRVGRDWRNKTPYFSEWETMSRRQ